MTHKSTKDNLFINGSDLTFKDISSEAKRVYVFPGKEEIEIKNPLKLNVSASGGHRIFNAEGYSFYIPAKWIGIRWKAKEGKPHFII